MSCGCAKDVIVARIVLEAKRLLALTDDTVAAISHELGFDEATNFIKYFRREIGTTPTALWASIHESDAYQYVVHLWFRPRLADRNIDDILPK
jgi:AraC-like DNA-binding protein